MTGRLLWNLPRNKKNDAGVDTSNGGIELPAFADIAQEWSYATPNLTFCPGTLLARKSQKKSFAEPSKQLKESQANLTITNKC